VSDSMEVWLPQTAFADPMIGVSGNIKRTYGFARIGVGGSGGDVRSLAVGECTFRRTCDGVAVSSINQIDHCGVCFKKTDTRSLIGSACALGTCAVPCLSRAGCNAEQPRATRRQEPGVMEMLGARRCCGGPFLATAKLGLSEQVARLFAAEPVSCPGAGLADALEGL
jgi:hypothetical protein